MNEPIKRGAARQSVKAKNYVLLGILVLVIMLLFALSFVKFTEMLGG